MILYLLIILSSEIFLVNCNHTKEQEDCVIRQLGECSTKYKVSSQFYPSNIDEIKQYCRAIEQNEQCFKSTWTQCIPEGHERETFHNKMTKFSSSHYKDLCNYNSTYSRLFAKHGKCLSETILEQKKCHVKYRILSQPKSQVLKAVGFTRDNSKAENIQKIRQLCCWWVEYQTCTVKSVNDKCGEQAGLLVNDEFFKSFTSNATSKILTYKSCISQDQTTRYPACFIQQSVDPKSLGLNFDNDHELDVEDSSRRKELEEMFDSKFSNNKQEFNTIEASTHGGVSSIHITNAHILLLVMIIYFSA